MPILITRLKGVSPSHLLVCYKCNVVVINDTKKKLHLNFYLINVLDENWKWLQAIVHSFCTGYFYQVWMYLNCFEQQHIENIWKVVQQQPLVECITCNFSKLWVSQNKFPSIKLRGKSLRSLLKWTELFSTATCSKSLQVSEYVF